jgi:hypothetical protein
MATIDIPVDLLANVMLTWMVTMISLYVLYKKWILPTIQKYTDAVPTKINTWVGNLKEELIERIGEKLQDLITSATNSVSVSTRHAKGIIGRMIAGKVVDLDKYDPDTINIAIEKLTEFVTKKKDPEKKQIGLDGWPE